MNHDGPSARKLALPLITILLWSAEAAVPNRLGSSAWAKSQEGAPEYLTPNIFADISEQTLPSVVSVYVKHNLKDQLKEFREQMEKWKDFLDEPQWRRFFNQPPGGEKDPEEKADPHGGAQEAKTSGSGVIISGEGFILTNNHIVGGAKDGTISVVLNDDTELAGEKVKVVAVDDYLDLAILKIEPAGLNLKPLAWGDSDRMRIGDWVLAIGNPLDLRGSVSKGIISAKGRKIGKVRIEHLLQTDAMINPGNSGGALVNLKGELIGINMAIATNSGFFQGIGFAIPSNDAKFITDQVIRDGRIRRGYIGIRMQPVEDKALCRALGIGDGASGILVENVVDGAPAAEAGVQAYDVITAIDGAKVKESDDVLGLIAGKMVGETAELAILREDKGTVKKLALKMKVVERPPDEELRRQQQITQRAPPKVKDEYSETRTGLGIKPYADEGMEGLEVVKVAANSPAARAGLEVGDVILEIHRKPVKTIGEFEKALERSEAHRPYLVRFLSRRRAQTAIAAIERETEGEKK